MSRFRLYALSARNQVGRALGLPVYTAGQKAVIKTMYDMYAPRAGWTLDRCACAIGCAEGEDSLLDPPTYGDHDKAGGMYQWWNPRRQIIKTNMKIDVWTCGPTDAARAFLGEISSHWAAPYNQTEPAFLKAETITDQMTVLLSHFERSKDQVRDLARRVPMAQSVRALIASEGWTTTT